jgi:adenosylhomocysteine nucleosidase
MTRIAVTFALPAESSAFLRRLRNKSRVDRSGIGTIRGDIDGRDVEVLHTGVGEKVCRQRVGKFLQDEQFEILISTGFAGALNDELHIGDLLLARNFSTVELNKRSSPFSRLPIHPAKLLTAHALIDSGDERNRIARTSGAAAVDMETEFIAHACAAHGVPLLALRVITDTPRKPLPAPLYILFDIERQRTHMTALAKFFLAHPNQVRRLVQFARRIAHAKRILAHALVAILRDL